MKTAQIQVVRRLGRTDLGFDFGLDPSGNPSFTERPGCNAGIPAEFGKMRGGVPQGQYQAKVGLVSFPRLEDADLLPDVCLEIFGRMQGVRRVGTLWEAIALTWHDGDFTIEELMVDHTPRNHILAWGTIVTNFGVQCVPCLYMEGDVWRIRMISLGDTFPIGVYLHLVVSDE